MTFRLLAQTPITDGKTVRKISFYEGDLAYIPKEHEVDLLVISSFMDDHVPTPGSVIGALNRRGVSVAELSKKKAVDLRKQSGFWLSERVDHFGLNVRQIACFEKPPNSTPAELVMALFAGLDPFIFAGDTDKDVAMSILGSGDMQQPADEMLKVMLRAADYWLARSWQVRELKIVTKQRRDINALAELVRNYKQRAIPTPLPSSEQTSERPTGSRNIFLSYKSDDEDAAKAVEKALTSRLDVEKVFKFIRTSDEEALPIAIGADLLDEIEKKIQESHVVVPLLTPEYFLSAFCKFEFRLSKWLDVKEGGFVYPILWSGEALSESLWLQTKVKADCRDRKLDQLVRSIKDLEFRHDGRSLGGFKLNGSKSLY